MSPITITKRTPGRERSVRSSRTDGRRRQDHHQAPAQIELTLELPQAQPRMEPESAPREAEERGVAVVDFYI